MTHSLELHLATSATSYHPGDTVVALLTASSVQSPADLQEVELQFIGTERVDTSWVSNSYRKKVAPINSDKRHVQRHAVLSRLQAATQGTLGGEKDRKFIVRFTLPTTISPSFRGTAVRVSYALSASVSYRASQYDTLAANSEPEGSVTSYGPSEAGTEQQMPDTISAEGVRVSTVHLPVHIWPAKAEAEQLTNSINGTGSVSTSSSDLADADVVTANDMPIKCWEIGSGTGVEEAIAHITRLVGQRPSAEAVMSSAEAAPSDISETTDDDAREGGSASSREDAASRVGPHSQRQPLLPWTRQGTPANEADRGLLTPSLHADPSSVLRSFALRIGEHAIGRISLHPPVEGMLYPGATLAGTVELLHPEVAGSSCLDESQQSGAVPRCMQVLILLETEEKVEPAWRAAGKLGQGLIRRVYEEQVDVTADLAATHFMFTVPYGSQANFRTQLLQLQWVLRFQFTVSTPKQGGSMSPLQGSIDQLTWTLPLQVGSPC